MIHDVAHFEAHGLPSVALISTGFRSQAEYQAGCLGLTGIPRVFVQHPISDQTDEQLYGKADAVFLEVVNCLLEDPAARLGDSNEILEEEASACST